MMAPAGTVATDLRTEVIRDPNRLAALRPDWLALLDRLGSDNPFVRPEWVLPWWQTFGADHRLATVAWWADASLCGLALLMATAGTHARLPATVLEFIGTPLADRMDILAEPGRLPDPAGRLLDAIACAPLAWDLLRLRELPDFSATVSDVAAAAAARGWTPVTRTCAHVPTLAVDAPAEQLRHAFGANIKNQTNNRRNRLRSRGAIAFERRLARPRDLEADLDTMGRLEAASWKGREGVGIFRTAEHRTFYRHAFRGLAAAGLVDVAFLRVDGAAVSYHLGFRLRGRYYSYNHAFDPAWADTSPGTVLLDEIIRESAGLPDIRVLDASRGRREAPHILARWSEAFHTHVELTLYPPRWYARGLRVLHTRVGPLVRAWWPGAPAAQAGPS